VEIWISKFKLGKWNTSEAMSPRKNKMEPISLTGECGK
jgi:hypothetical protein